jgi:hypothetical protein
MSHKHKQIYKTHHGLDLKEATTFPFILFFMISHKGYTQMSFCLGTPNLEVLKFLKLTLSKLWRPISSSIDLRLKWGLKQSGSPQSAPKVLQLCINLFVV